ncbi:MAG: AAA family ATPase [Acutalibacteraceae bacterium]
MICQFSFKNFKSYKDETVFDFQAAKLDEFVDSLITSENSTPLLPVSVIYGPNGGGKTSLLQALSCLITFVVEPIYRLDKNKKPMIFQHRVANEPFCFDEISSKLPTEFNIYFRTKQNEYRYYISIFDNHIVSEYLYRKKLGAKKPAMIFEREENKIELGSSVLNSSINTKVNQKMPYLSFLAINYEIPVISEVQEWFESCIIRNYANPKAEKNILISDDEKFKKSFITAINDMGIDISDYAFDKEKNQFILKRTIKSEPYWISFEKESEGTKKIFAIFPIIMHALMEGCLIIVDELDSKLHPKLLRYIVSLFTNSDINKNGAQLLFTCHDISILKKNVFRRDEIWFACLDKSRSSELYSLYDIRKEDGKRINSTAAYDKQYLEGRYGADPYLETMLSWEDLI